MSRTSCRKHIALQTAIAHKQALATASGVRTAEVVRRP
jgi:hypothetical protein